MKPEEGMGKGIYRITNNDIMAIKLENKEVEDDNNEGEDNLENP